MQLSTRVRAAQADAIETTVGTAPKFQLFDGAMPATPATADAGTKLSDDALPSDWLTNPADGTKAKNGTWSLNGIANGWARYFRIKDSGGTNCDFQGLCGQNWVASTNWTLNQNCVNDSGKCYKCTTAGLGAGSGGPTGTGGAITDGAAVWQYLGLVDVVMTNTNVANGQAASVTTFTLTTGNA